MLSSNHAIPISPFMLQVGGRDKMLQVSSCSPLACRHCCGQLSPAVHILYEAQQAHAFFQMVTLKTLLTGLLRCSRRT